MSENEAWDQVTGSAVGQALSERITQLAAPSPQFGLGKSLPGFGPDGSVDGHPDESTTATTTSSWAAPSTACRLQKGPTRVLVLSVPALIAKLSRKLPLLPGDDLVRCVTGIGELR